MPSEGEVRSSRRTSVFLGFSIRETFFFLSLSLLVLCSQVDHLYVKVSAAVRPILREDGTLVN